jgi:excisionase family DNA binding protein
MDVRSTRRASEVSLQPKLLLTIDEAAIAMSLGRTVLYGLVMRNEVASIKLGRSRRIPMVALQEYVRQRLAEVQPAS